MNGPSRRRWKIAAAAIAVAAFVLGLVGYLKSTPFLHALYNTLSLYTLGFTIPDGKTPGTIPVGLEIARFLAPAATVLAAVQLAASVLRDQIDVIVARRTRRHVVVCGLGPVGIATVLRLRDPRAPHRHGITKVLRLRTARNDLRVVAIERDATCPNIVAARVHGARVVIGDARIATARARANVRAAHWFVWTPSEWLDGEDLVEKLHADLAHTRSRRRAAEPDDESQTALIRVRDLALCTMFRRDVLIHAGDASVADLDTDFFNELENTAQRLLWHTTRGYAAATPGDPYELWIVGSGPIAEALVVQAVRNWWGCISRPRLTIRIFADDADAFVGRVDVRWPEVDAAGTLHAETGPAEAAVTFDVGDGMVPRAVFVVVDDEERALHLGLQFLEETPIARVAIAATSRYPPTETDPRAEYFDTVQFGLDSDTLMFDTFELLGRMIHQHSVLRARVGADHEVAHDDDPSGPGQEWSDLAPVWRASNRDAARAIVGTLLAAGHTIVRLGTSGTTPDTLARFTDEQLDTMAEREHERWLRFMTGHGWTLGPVRDNDARIHPGLRHWADASPEDRATTRDQIGEYPRLLALLGFAVVPVGAPYTAGRPGPG